MTDTPQEPLWRVMDRAAYPKPQPQKHSYRAAEIRAVADWLVPAKEKPNDEFCYPPVSTMLWSQHQQLRQRLLAEADRAERGEG